MSLVCLLTGTAVNLTLIYKTTGALECHCTSGCNFNLECLGTSNCTRGWSGPTCQRYNLALGKDTHQSSTLNDCPWANNATKKACGWKNSSLAVDGIRSTDYWSGTCIHTHVNQNQAWWSVNLGQRHQIYYIKIYSPIKNPQRMKGFKVTVDNQPCYTSPPYDNLVPPISIHCTTPINGTNISISAHQNDFILNLCEVEVYECINGVFGEGCSSPCNCKDPDEVCDKVTGQCQSGCVDGFTGEGGQTNCLNGHYGFNCSKVCGHCRGGDSSCNRVDGKCTRGCNSNWAGDQCKECEDRKFGARCSYSCKCKNPNEVCNKTTGHCNSGCTDGYRGDGCQTPCKEGTYGHACSGTCGRCLKKKACDKQQGDCPAGCEEGFLEPLCQACRERHYGSDCRRCGQCLANSPCNKLTGKCPGECQPGWKGNNCHEAETAKSGTIKVFDFVESKAPATVDGNPALTRDGNTSLASCVTLTGTLPSWKITFDNKHTIYGVGIYMRIVDNSSQINVQVDGSFCHYGFLFEEKEVQHFTPCPEPIEGRSVTIYLQNKKKEINLTLCEVTVFVSDEENVPIFSITLSIVGLTIMMVIGVVIFIAMRHRIRSQKTKAAIEDKNKAKYINATYQPGDSSNEQLEESEGHNYEVLPMDGNVYEEPIRT